MEWNIAPQTFAEEILNFNTQESTPMEITSIQTFADFDGSAGRNLNTKVLPLTVAVNESIGGEATPANQLGFTTGIYPMSASRGGFNGGTIVPINSAVIFASEQYGDVGLSNRNEVMVQALSFMNNDYTPDNDNAAQSFTNPGFMFKDVNIS